MGHLLTGLGYSDNQENLVPKRKVMLHACSVTARQRMIHSGAVRNLPYYEEWTHKNTCDIFVSRKFHLMFLDHGWMKMLQKAKLTWRNFLIL